MNRIPVKKILLEDNNNLQDIYIKKLSDEYSLCEEIYPKKLESTIKELVFIIFIYRLLNI